MSKELIAGLGGALIGAMLTGVFAWLLQRAQEVSKHKQELRSVITALVDLRQHYEQEVAPMSDFRAKDLAGGFANTRKTIFLEAADILLRQIPQHVSSSEYNILAYEQMLDSNFEEAEKNFLRAIKASRTTMTRVIALRAMAAFYFSPGPRTNFDKGRECYVKAARELSDKPADPYSLYTLGFTYESWGWSELANGFESEGQTQLDRAHKYYVDLPDAHPVKPHALGALAAKRQLSTLAQVPPPSPGLAAARAHPITPVTTIPVSASPATTTVTTVPLPASPASGGPAASVVTGPQP